MFFITFPGHPLPLAELAKQTWPYPPQAVLDCWRIIYNMKIEERQLLIETEPGQGRIEACAIFKGWPEPRYSWSLPS